MSDFLSAQPGDPGNSRLASNNPFRNRAVSPSLPSPTSPFDDPPPRPLSRNPFLDPGNGQPVKKDTDLLIDVNDMSSTTAPASGNQSSLADIFNSFNVEDKTLVNPNDPKPSTSSDPHRSRSPRVPGAGSKDRGRPGGGPPPRVKNIPPRPSPSSGHRPSPSQEEAMKKRQQAGGRIAKGEPAGGPSDGSSGRRPSHPSRPRRNSDSSVAGNDKGSRGDKAIRDIRRREASHRERGSSRPNRRNDIIDQMDATSIFGTVFHHDGPFDALNPHRNRKNSRRPPIQAFPKDSLNNVLGGSGPLNARPDHATFMGHADEEAFTDFATGKRVDKSGSSIVTPVFDPMERASILHGDQSLGLGTSTFLEGTPAARAAIQRREAERAQDSSEGGLQRKKSIAQRFRSINRGPREPPAARAFSTDSTPVPPIASPSARAGYGSDRNPYDEFDSKKGDDVITVRKKGSNAPTSPSSPPRLTLERRSTTDGASATSDFPEPPAPPADEPPQRTGGGGLLARVKSLKGGRRPAPPPPLKDS